MRGAKRYVQKLNIGLVHKFGMERDRKFRFWARSELGIGHDFRWAFRTGGIRTWGRNRAVKANRLILLLLFLFFHPSIHPPVCLSVSLSVSVCVCVCVCMCEVSVVGRFIRFVASLSVNTMDSACLLGIFSGLLLTLTLCSPQTSVHSFAL